MMAGSESTGTSMKKSQLPMHLLGANGKVGPIQAKIRHTEGICLKTEGCRNSRVCMFANLSGRQVFAALFVRMCINSKMKEDRSCFCHLVIVFRVGEILARL